MPPRFTPFYQSLANRGMKQTNKNIGNINNPGGGNIYDPGDFSGEGFPIGGQGTEPPIGGWYKPWGPNPNYDPDDGINPDLTDPFEEYEDLNNDGVVDIHDIILSNMGPGSKTKTPLDVLPPGYGFAKPPSPSFPERPNIINPDWGGLIEDPNLNPQFPDPDKPWTETLPEGWEWQFINGEWIPQEVEAAPGGGQVNIPDYPQEGPHYGPGGGQTNPSDVTHPFVEGSMAAGFDINNDGVVDILDYQSAQQPLTSESEIMSWWMGLNEEGREPYTSAYSAQQEFDEEGIPAGDDFITWLYNQDIIPYEEGFLDNLQQYINPMQSSAQQFTGGGGQAGAAAKKLYYPGTSGGFASVGSGIGGGNTLEELLKKYR